MITSADCAACVEYHAARRLFELAKRPFIDLSARRGVMPRNSNTAPPSLRDLGCRRCDSTTS